MRSPAALLILLLAAAAARGAPQLATSTVIGVDPNLSQGAMALRLKNFEEGIRLTRIGLKTEVAPRQRAIAFSNICAGHVGLRQFPEAIESCNEALELNPRLWRAYNNRALAWLGQGNVPAARRDVDAGLAINPDSRSLRESQALVQAAAELVTVAGEAPLKAR